MHSQHLMHILDRPIAFHSVFIGLGVGITGALMLSQALYWSRRTRDSDGWFYKTRDEWTKETFMTRYEQEGARKALRKTGILQEKKRGIPCTVHFRVDYERLEELLVRMFARDSAPPTNQLAENQQTVENKRVSVNPPVGGKPATQLGENQPTGWGKTSQLYTETTTETTTEITEEPLCISPVSQDLTATKPESAPKARKRAAPKFTPPTVADVFDYMRERGHEDLAEAEKFFNYWESVGWTRGRTKMKDWKASVRTWLRNVQQFSRPAGNNGYRSKAAGLEAYNRSTDDEFERMVLGGAA